MNDETKLEIVVPDEHQTGVYSNLAVISHQTEHDFTLDFCQIVPGESGGSVAIVVARVKAAPSFLFPLMSTISKNLDRYEENVKRAKGQTEGDAEND